MHPLNTFPALLDYVRFTPLILRIIIGIFIVSVGLGRKNKDFAYLSVFYFIFGAAIFVGFYTQISAIVSILILKLDFYLEYWKNRKSSPIPHKVYQLYTLAIFVLLSLIVSGAGLIALDMPF